MSVALQLAILWIVMIAVMTLGWLWQWRRTNAGIVDVLWSVGLGIGAMWMAVTGTGASTPRWLLAVLGGTWSIRLAVHLWGRVRGESEDGRYQALRQRWQRGTQWKFFALFQLQALLVPVFALPFVAVARNPVGGLSVGLVSGVLIWVISVSGEAIADAQLTRFRSNPAHRGKTCRRGLWRYSRHPNYFFEWLHWFTYVALAWGSTVGWLSVAGPVVMYVFLRWLSGIPYTEAQALRSRGDDYRGYQRTTSMLFPWFPKTS